MKHQVYDSRTNEVLFEDDEQIKCVNYILDNVDEDSDDFDHIWIKTV
ncbi:hypothetical protein [uncultured Metabacillus sp.]|nr:hypothetical protein [uncultured Metabacillus sp.]